MQDYLDSDKEIHLQCKFLRMPIVSPAMPELSMDLQSEHSIFNDAIKSFQLRQDQKETKQSGTLAHSISFTPLEEINK